jgi:hypothetical protein
LERGKRKKENTVFIAIYLLVRKSQIHERKHRVKGSFMSLKKEPLIIRGRDDAESIEERSGTRTMV